MTTTHQLTVCMIHLYQIYQDFLFPIIIIAHDFEIAKQYMKEVTENGS